MSDPPFASIIVPVFNHERFIGAALDSILAQSDPDWEAIVVDDGSTDATPAIIEDYAARYPRIITLHKANGGVSSALNAGLQRARGAWTHWLSSDDMFVPEKLEVNRRWIAAHPGIKFFFSYFWLLWETTGQMEQHGLWGPLPEVEYQILTLFYRNFINGISICVAREVWDEVGLFNDHYQMAQDVDQWLRIFSRYRGVFVSEWTVISRHHPDQGSSQFQEACYYDAAKAAIDLINRHPFAELVPWVDLAEPAAAAAAVEKAFEIACEPAGFLYALGAHPALVLRLLEWLFSGDDGEAAARSDLQALARERIRAQALAEGDGDWAWMWRGLAVACAAPNPCFVYTAVDTLALQRQEYAARRCGRGVGLAPGEAPLREYLRRFEGVEESPQPPPASGSAALVLLLPPDRAAIAAAIELARLGHRPVVIAPAETAYRLQEGVPVIARGGCDRDSLPWLGEVDMVAIVGAGQPPAWIDALATVSITEAELGDAEAIADQVLAGLGFETTPRCRRTVAFLGRVLWGGGAERVVHDVVRHLDRRRYMPVVLTLFDASSQRSRAPEVPSFWVGEFGYDGPSIGSPSALPATEGASPSAALDPIPSDIAQRRSSVVATLNAYWPAAEGLRNLLHNLGPDTALVTVMEEAAATAWVAQIGGKIPYVASLYTVESIYLPEMYPDPGRHDVEEWAFRSACESAERVISISQACAVDLADQFGIDPARQQVISCSTNCSRVRLHSWAPDPKATLLAAEHRDVYVHLGRLSPEKNHDLLLQAGALLRAKGRNFLIVCIGTGGDRERLDSEVVRLNLSEYVMFAGEWKNPFPMIARAAALVLTSRFEGFAVVLPEAMACGTPVISTDCPGGPREVLRDGQCGILVPPNDPQALCEAMERIAEDAELRRLVVSAGFERCADFAPLAIAKQWEDAIDRVLPIPSEINARV